MREKRSPSSLDLGVVDEGRRAFGSLPCAGKGLNPLLARLCSCFGGGFWCFHRWKVGVSRPVLSYPGFWNPIRSAGRGFHRASPVNAGQSGGLPSGRRWFISADFPALESRRRRKRPAAPPPRGIPATPACRRCRSRRSCRRWCTSSRPWNPLRSRPSPL